MFYLTCFLAIRRLFKTIKINVGFSFALKTQQFNLVIPVASLKVDYIQYERDHGFVIVSDLMHFNLNVI